MIVSRERETSIHEASHALGFWYFGGLIEGVWCQGKENLVRGHHAGRFSGGQDRVDEMILILLAGPCAALKLFDNPWSIDCYRLEEVEDCIELLEFRGWKLPKGMTTSIFWACYSPPARAFVDDPVHWQMIVALADELSRKKYMSGKAVAYFLESQWRKIFSSFFKLMPTTRSHPPGALGWEKHGGEEIQ